MQVYQSTEIQYSMTREQKQAVGLLSMGTFLEYFDLMLYVHMAVLLNELFFPKTDPHTTQLLSAVTFCSTYVFRPFGALFFGWIGDTIGRKYTIIMTTGLMAASCVMMAMAPTYAEVGITAAYIMIGCRILQGVAAMGEVVGALLYLTELIKKPSRFFAIAMIPVFCDLGSLCAISFAALATSYFHNWRMAFWVGATLALVGVFARTALRETPDFADASRKLANIKSQNQLGTSSISEEEKLFLDHTQKSNKKSYIALFLLECMWPICFYFVYVFCGDLLKNNFGYTAAQVISHNLVVTLLMLAFCMLKSILCRFFHPLIIFKYRLIISLILYLITPFWLDAMNSSFEIGVLQVLVVIFSADIKFAVSTIYPHFPVLKRFKAAAVLYALSRAITYVITSFGMIYLVKWIGNWGIFLALFLASLGVLYGFMHFWKLEKATGDLVKYAIIRNPEIAKTNTAKYSTS